MMTFEEAYEAWAAYVDTVVRSRLALYGLPELSFEEVRTDVWSRIWLQWAWVSKGSPPLRAAVKVARDACSECKNRVVGRTAMMRGKPYRWPGTRDVVLASELETRLVRRGVVSRGPDAAWALVWREGRGRRQLQPDEVCECVEMLDRAGLTECVCEWA